MRIVFANGRDPVPSGISKWLRRHISQEVCPWNQRFARALSEDSPFAPREFIAGKDARQLARDPLAMSQEEFSAAFRSSPMKRAKLAGLKRNAAVVLGSAGTNAEIDVLERAVDDPERLVRAPAAWALARLRPST